MSNEPSPFAHKCKTKKCKRIVKKMFASYCCVCKLKRKRKNKHNFHPQGKYIVA